MTRWAAAVVIGTLVSWPLAWLLSHAALLPFFLGIFFFALFGLIIGAVMHRVAAPARPLPKAALWGGTTWIVVFVCGFSLIQEAHDIPRKLAKAASERTRDIGDRPTAVYIREMEGNIREVWRDKHGSTGPRAYVPWILAGGEFAPGEVPGVQTTLRAGVSGAWWLVRVALSVGLLAFGVSSQTLALRLHYDPGVRRKTTVEPGSPTVPEASTRAASTEGGG